MATARIKAKPDRNIGPTARQAAAANRRSLRRAVLKAPVEAGGGGRSY